MKKVLIEGKEQTVTDKMAARLLHYNLCEVKEEKAEIETKEEKKTRSTKAKK